jgi:hypothetical protein
MSAMRPEEGNPAGDVMWAEVQALRNRVAELEAEVRTLRNVGVTQAERVEELEAAAKDMWPLVNEVRAIVADHYPDGTKHDDLEYTRRRSVTAALVRQALALRDALEPTASVGGDAELDSVGVVERLEAWIAAMRDMAAGSDVPKNVGIMTKKALDGAPASQHMLDLLRVYRARVPRTARAQEAKSGSGSSPAGSVDASEGHRLREARCVSCIR